MPYHEAEQYLAAADPLMRRLIKAHGACALEPQVKRSPFESLVRAIAHQQLHGKAAEAILARLLAHTPKRFPKPEELLAMEEGALRACGFSLSKIVALRDIARHTALGTVPTRARIAKLSDEEIITRLTALRGVGRWTVEMLLIFQLGRLDVLPVDDFGVRNGFRVAMRREDMPKPKELKEYGGRWAPYRTIASWYLWRAADASKVKIRE